MSQVRGVDVNIMGREFTVSCTDEERESLLASVNYLDRKMRDIQNSGKVVGIDRIAVMAALNVTHEMLNGKSGLLDTGAMRREINQMQEAIETAKTELAG